MRSEATARWAVQLTKFVADMRTADLQHVDLKAKNLTLVVSSETPDGLGDDCLCLGFRPLLRLGRAILLFLQQMYFIHRRFDPSFRLIRPATSAVQRLSSAPAPRKKPVYFTKQSRSPQ